MGNCCSKRPHSHPGDPTGAATNTILMTAPTPTGRAQPPTQTALTEPSGSVAVRDKADVFAAHPSEGTQTSTIGYPDVNTTDIAALELANRKATNETNRHVQPDQPALNDDGGHRGTPTTNNNRNVAALSGVTKPAPFPAGNHANPVGTSSAGRVLVGADSGFNLTVIPTDVKPDPASPEDEKNLLALREKCPRFRILVIGKANAGKTTILQKMCNTTEAPVIKDREGNVLDPSIINPTDGRGIHDINNELTFSTNTGFVFHDSAGFEAGSTTELESVQRFIGERAVAKNLKEQLHAIWYCLPTDNDRPLSNGEMSFFQQGTGKVPVIAIFTKYDGMILKQYNRLRYEESYSKEDARVHALHFAEEVFLNSEHYLKKLQAAAYPPTKYMCVQGMHLAGSTCSELSRQTVEALDSKKLQLLFVSVQLVNVELCTELALKEFVLKALAESDHVESEQTMLALKDMVLCYGHLAWNWDYSEPTTTEEDKKEDLDIERDWDDDYHQHPQLASIMEPTLSSLAVSRPSPLQILRVATSILIIAEDSLWFSAKGAKNDEAFRLAWENYEASGKAAVVAERVRALSEVNFGDLWQDDKDSSGDDEDGSGEDEDGSGDNEDSSGDDKDSSGDDEDNDGDDEDAMSKAKEEWVQNMCAIIKEFRVQPQA